MKRIRFASIFLAFGLALSACNLPTSSSKSSSVAATAAAQTQRAALSATVTATEAPAVPPTLTATPTKVPCDDNATYTVWTRNNVPFTAKEIENRLAPGTTFRMSWTLKNTGKCTWNSAYQMVFDSGTSLTSSTSFPILTTGKLVEPGGIVTVQIQMTAPAQAGDYQSGFHLQNDQGKAVINFGVATKVGGKPVSRSPSSPGNLQYTYDCTSGSVSISLLWADRSNDEIGYRVYRDGTKVADLPPGSTSYTDTAPSSGTYQYTVSAFNASGESPAGISVDTVNCK